MTTAAYSINFSDTSKEPIIIDNQTVNNDTTLTLFGRDSESWGQLLNNNLIKILENFCNDYVPGYTNQVLEGQLWYDSGNKQLKLCTDSTTLEWTPLSHIPSPELTGIVTSSSLNLTLADYIPLNGNLLPMTGPLLVLTLGDYSSKLSVATKKYVDSIVCKCATADDNWATNYLSDDGGIISTKLILSDNTSDTRFAAPVKYITSKNDIKVDYPDVITIVNSNGTVTDDITGQFTSWTSNNAGFYKYYGTISIPSTTTLTPHIVTCTLPYDFGTDYNVVVTGTVLNNLDVSGTTNTGAACDVYVDIVSGTEFQIKCTASTFAQLIYVNFYGHKL